MKMPKFKVSVVVESEGPDEARHTIERLIRRDADISRYRSDMAHVKSVKNSRLAKADELDAIAASITVSKIRGPHGARKVKP